VLLKRVEPVAPSAALLIDPTAEHRQLIGSQPAGTSGALASLLDETTPPQHAYVMGDGLRRQVERLGELSHGGVTLGEASHQRATDRIAESGEGQVEVRVRRRE